MAQKAFDKFFECAPVDKTAAVVTNQKRCTAKLSGEQRRENLVSRWRCLRDELAHTPKNSHNHARRVCLGTEIERIGIELSKYKKIWKENFPQLFIEVCRESLPEGTFRAIVETARSRTRKMFGKED